MAKHTTIECSALDPLSVKRYFCYNQSKYFHHVCKAFREQDLIYISYHGNANSNEKKTHTQNFKRETQKDNVNNDFLLKKKVHCMMDMIECT